MSALWEARFRVLKFAAVGALCFGLQYSVLVLLKWLGIAAPLANAAGFVASAQVNYLLSSAFTWGDRDLSGGRLLRWTSYNATVLVSLAVNTLVFAAVHRLTGDLVGALCGVAVGTVVTFLAGDLLVFRGSAPRPLTVERVETMPVAVAARSDR